MLTISELASYAGVTVRAVRHYHARGLLPEPERDASGYRRYDANAVVALVRIKTLAEAGVPLSRVSELLKAEPAEFEAAVAEIDRELMLRISKLRGHRRRVAELVSGDGLTLPPEVVGLLDRLRGLGVAEPAVAMERDAWILLVAHAPDKITEWVQQKHDGLDDPQFQQVYRHFGEAFDWSPDDPRLEAFADDIATFLGRAIDEYEGDLDDVAFDDGLAQLLDDQTLLASPAWTRLGQLVRARGFVGWTNVQRAADRRD